MTRFSDIMSGQTLLPIIQANSPEEGVNIARAMAEAGLSLVEVVLRTEASLDALVAIKQAVPELKVGAGTVLNDSILRDALDGGRRFYRDARGVREAAVSIGLLFGARSARCIQYRRNSSCV